MQGDGSPPVTGVSRRDRAAFLITIDAEGDGLWSKPRHITARNAEVLPRFQELCERYSLKPTYLVNWEMVNSEPFVMLGQAALKRATAEIGMHLHAWNSPPLIPLTDDDFKHQPYLMEYPPEQLRHKIRVMTDKLETTFGVKIRSHRAGRWGFNETYAQALIDSGYLVDCSVTPHVDWRSHRGDPAGKGGPDFRRFPEMAYYVDPNDISRPGQSPLLEIPMTIVSGGSSTRMDNLRSGMRRILGIGHHVDRVLPAYRWLRPNGRNLASLLRILSNAQERGRGYVEFMLHSSELMAGGSPTFRTREQIEALYDDLEALFDAASQHWTGMTLSEYRGALSVNEAPPS